MYVIALHQPLPLPIFIDGSSYPTNVFSPILGMGGNGFFFKNCSDQLSEKIVLVIEKNYGEFEAEGQEFANILRSLEQFLGKGKSQNNFRNRMFI